ncbi:MAG TPA: hypothetical protein VD865_17590 [Stenotrophomonas sp.]|nr:hypothetical protein [Stenotrophomonas sp.]
MNFEKLRRRVDRAEWLVEGRAEETRVHWTALRHGWREGWTAPRIVVAGLITGFIAGKLQPSKGRAVASQATRWVQIFSAVSSMFTAMQARTASEEAERAGDHAERAADNADVVATETPAAASAAAAAAAAAAASTARTREPESPYAAADAFHPPRAAEAATDVSER